MSTPEPTSTEKGETVPDAQDRSDSDNELHSERQLAGLSWLLVILAVISPTFLYALDNTVMANVRPSIIDRFGHIQSLTWLSVSYPLGELGANPLWFVTHSLLLWWTLTLARGKLNEQFNNKTVFLAAVLIFEIGSAVIGSAQSAQAVIVGRAIAGFGGSGIYVGTINIISRITTPVERTKYLNFVGMSWSLGTVLGPIIGGAFADSAATWRWAFYINICIAACSLPICIWLVPSIAHPTSATLFERIKRIDYLGAVLFLGGVASIVMVLGFGGADYEWDSKQMIGLYVATVLVWSAFIIQQGLCLLTVDRIFPAQLVRDWTMINLFSWTAIAISNVVVTIYTLPLFLQFTYGDTSLRSAVFTLPFVLSVVASAGAGGPLFSKYPFYMPWFAGASAILLISNGLLSTIKYTTSRGAICGYTVLQGIGVGPVIQLGYTVGQTKVSRNVVPQVTAFLTCAQMAGLALSLGIATSVFLNSTTADIAAILPDMTRDFILASINGVRTGLLHDLSTEARIRVLQTIARNAGEVFYLNIAGAALGLATAVTMKWERLKL